MRSFGFLTMPAAFVPSSGMSVRTSRSVASSGLRAGMSILATTASVSLRPDCPALSWAELIR